jgi:hypothetical protein
MKTIHTYKCRKCANEWVSRECKLSETIEQSDRKQSGVLPIYDALMPACPFEDVTGPANFKLIKTVVKK